MDMHVAYEDRRLRRSSVSKEQRAANGSCYKFTTVQHASSWEDMTRKIIQPPLTRHLPWVRFDRASRAVRTPEIESGLGEASVKR
jgi:hypothetical protein